MLVGVHTASGSGGGGGGDCGDCGDCGAIGGGGGGGCGDCGGGGGGDAGALSTPPPPRLRGAEEEEEGTCAAPARGVVAAARGVPSPKVLVVLQNNDTIYWQLLAQQGHHEVEIVRIDAARFCVVNTPPVMVQQSYLNWIEYHVDTVDHDQLERNFRHLLGLVARALGVRLPRAVRDLAIFGPEDPDLADELEVLPGLLH